MNVDLLLALFCLVLTVALFAAPQFTAMWAVLGAAAAIIAYAAARLRR